MPEPLVDSDELATFLKYLYRETEGYVWSPTLDRNTKNWNNKFFQWPADREQIIDHIHANTSDRDVYIGPALYKTNNVKAGKSNVLGSHTVWAEFDGRIPTFDNGTPRPAFWINSSSREHLHVYWSLSEFCTDINLLESVNRALAHNLKADSSGWDATQILRPPHTINHKHGIRTSRLQRNNSYLPINIVDLAAIPAPEPVIKEDLDTTNLPTVLDVAARNDQYSKQLWEIFQKPSVDQGERSSKLMALGYFMAEKKFTDLDMYAILSDAARRWGKFEGRQDRKRRLLDIIERARQKYPLESTNYGSSLGFKDILESEIEVEWVLQDVLEEQGISILSGPPGCGKTQLSLQFGIHLALGLPFLGFTPTRQRKILFLSLEMGHAAIKKFMAMMATELTTEQLSILQENFRIHPIGADIPLDSVEGQQTIKKFLQEDAPDGIMFDSFGMSVDEDLNSNTAIKTVFKFVNRTKADYDCFFWFIHHNRKAQSLNKKPNKLSDIYGSQYISANASTVLGLWPDGGTIELSALKVRLGPTFNTFHIVRRSESLNFDVATGMQGLVESPKEVSFHDNDEISDFD